MDQMDRSQDVVLWLFSVCDGLGALSEPPRRTELNCFYERLCEWILIVIIMLKCYNRPQKDFVFNRFYAQMEIVVGKDMFSRKCSGQETRLYSLNLGSWKV